MRALYISEETCASICRRFIAMSYTCVQLSALEGGTGKGESGSCSLTRISHMTPPLSSRRHVLPIKHRHVPRIPIAHRGPVRDPPYGGRGMKSMGRRQLIPPTLQG